jgi:hypothetical protein
VNHCDRNAEAGIDTRWNFDRAGNFLTTRGGCVSDSKSFAILTGSQPSQDQRQHEARD